MTPTGTLAAAVTAGSVMRFQSDGNGNVDLDATFTVKMDLT